VSDKLADAGSCRMHLRRLVYSQVANVRAFVGRDDEHLFDGEGISV
jgi:hypothetical protein